MNIHLKAKHPFWLKGGKAMHSLNDLHDELKMMPADVFSHHVNAAKNDFATWVEHSVEHPTLAGKLKSSIDRSEHLRHIGEALAPPKITATATKAKTVKQQRTPCDPKIQVFDQRTILALHEPRKILSNEQKTNLSLHSPRQPIVSDNKTETHLTHTPHRIHSSEKTSLMLTQHYERILTQNKTLLSLIHSPERANHALTVISYLCLGIVFGAGLLILMLAI